jgi:hypothetical protein
MALRILIAGLTLLLCGTAHTAQWALRVTDEKGVVAPCRVHLRHVAGDAVKPPGAPFWSDHFVCDGEVTLELAPGEYHFEIERGPEHESARGDFKITATSEKQTLTVTVRRIADLARDGWWSGETHVHRPAGLGTRTISLEAVNSEIAMHLRAEDLHIAPVITWWNQRSLWKDMATPAAAEALRRVDGDRFFNLLAGEDERGGGALLFFNLHQPLDLPEGGRAHPEYPSSSKFLQAAKREPGAWVDVEKPFWLDAPMWFASGLVDSVGIAHNHMNRSGVRDEEAWGRARARDQFPGPQGNGLWTQEIYYNLLECGVRLPPSAGSASGVLPNPVGYNRAYVQVDGALSWEKWWDGLRAGRVFVTNGPLLRVRANGEWPGHVFKIAEGESTLRVHLDALLDGRDPMSQVEIIKNGRVLRRVPVTDLQRTGALGEIAFNESGWFLVRVIADVPETFRFASTGPYYVEAAKQPRRVSRQSAQFFADWMHDRIGNLKLDDPGQREEVLRPLRETETYWLQKGKAATVEE